MRRAPGFELVDATASAPDGHGDDAGQSEVLGDMDEPALEAQSQSAPCADDAAGAQGEGQGETRRPAARAAKRKKSFVACAIGSVFGAAAYAYAAAAVTLQWEL